MVDRPPVSIPYPQPSIPSIMDTVLASKEAIETMAGMKASDIGRVAWYWELQAAIARLNALMGGVEAVGLTASYTVTPQDDGKIFVCDCTAGAITLSLPPIGLVPFGFSISAVKSDAGANLVFFQASGAELVIGATSRSITFQYHSARVFRGPDQWYFEVSPQASAGDVLGGTNTFKTVTSDALAALWEKAPIVSLSAGVLTLGEGGYTNVLTAGETITDIDFQTPKDGRRMWVRVIGSGCTLVHSATLLLPGGVNASLVPNDRFLAVEENADNIFVLDIVKQSGKSVIPPSWSDISGGTVSNGVPFPATAVASADANTLDDYEEGTFTPGLTFGGAAVGMTTSILNGRYTKIGRQVTFGIWILLTAKGSSTGVALVTGLPFTPDSQVLYIPTFKTNGLAAAVTTSLMAHINQGATTINLSKFAAGVVTQLQDTDFNANSAINLTGSYFV